MLHTWLAEEGRWKTFNDFEKHSHKIWVINLDRENSENSINAMCSCPFFLKHLICKHALGLHIPFKLCDVPILAKNISLGQNKKRGRPARAKKALLVQ